LFLEQFVNAPFRAWARSARGSGFSVWFQVRMDGVLAPWTTA
jgi:hypothetical protein